MDIKKKIIFFLMKNWTFYWWRWKSCRLLLTALKAGATTVAATSGSVVGSASVAVHFECSDSLSNVELCTPDTIISSEGEGTSHGYRWSNQYYRMRYRPGVESYIY